MSADRTRAFVRFAWITLAVTVVVIVWGAVVRATGSGAGCGSHWPLCNGEVVPLAPSTSTIIEFTHRLTSGLALILSVVLVVWSRRLVSAGPSRSCVGRLVARFHARRGRHRRRHRPARARREQHVGAACGLPGRASHEHDAARGGDYGGDLFRAKGRGQRAKGGRRSEVRGQRAEGQGDGPWRWDS